MMETVDHLIHARWLITCEEKNQILENASLAIKDGKILALLPTEQAKQKYTASSEENYPHHVILPGFINSHTHIAMNVFRGLADDLELMDWLTNHIWPAETKWVSHDLVYDASLLAMSEMIRGGTTCFNDMYFFMDATAKAAEKIGIRAHLGMTVIDVPTSWAKNADEYFAKGLEFYDQYKNHKTVVPTMAPHSTYTVSLEHLAKCNEIAKERNLKINIHLHEAPSEIEGSLKKYGKRPLDRLHEIGMLTSDLIAIHMTQLNENDLELVNQTKPNIVHCPESNMKLASGNCPVQRLLDSSINVALGTDGAASNNDLDMIGEARSAAFLGKVIANDPRALKAESALRMATLHGAKALGIDHLTGSLTAGKSADFIAIDLAMIETQPLYHLVSQVIYAASRFQVTDTWVCGKQVMKNRVLTTFSEKEVLEKAHKWQEKIYNSSKIYQHEDLKNAN